MKNLKKNNKGFSLVELIVVVLIIAIIAVALAPQVIKWVGEARNNTTKNNAATIKSAIQSCVADYMAQTGSVSNTTVLVEKGKVTIDGTTPVTSASSGSSLTLGQLIFNAVEGLSDTHKYSYSINTNGTVKTVNVDDDTSYAD